jgi:hypothetical protein
VNGKPTLGATLGTAVIDSLNLAASDGPVTARDMGLTVADLLVAGTVTTALGKYTRDDVSNQVEEVYDRRLAYWISYDTTTGWNALKQFGIFLYDLYH